MMYAATLAREAKSPTSLASVPRGPHVARALLHTLARTTSALDAGGGRCGDPL